MAVEPLREPLQREPRFVDSILEGYIFLRLLLAIVLLGGASVASWGQPDTLLAIPFEVAALLCLFMGISAMLVRRYKDEPWFLWAQMGLDTIFATSLVSLSAGPDTSYAVIYVLSIVAAARLLDSRGVLIVTALNVVAYCGISVAGLVGLLGWDLSLDLFFLYTQTLVRIFGLMLVGVLSTGLVSRGVLSAQIQRTRSIQQAHAALLDRLPLAILSVEKGIVTAANAESYRILGLSVGDAAVLPTDEDVWEQQIVLDGEDRWLAARCRALDGGGLIYIFEDITRLREMEAHVERDERLAAVGRLAASLAHEIRNPLASLSGSVQLLDERGSNPLHRIILREVQRLNDLVEDFLQTARPMKLSLSPVNLQQMLHEVVEAFRNDPRCRGLREVKLSTMVVPRVLADAARLRQVIWNLLLNAVQATDTGGQISVDAVLITDHIELTIRDNGVGIAQEKLLHIFDPFYTTRAGGTGLGLALVDRIIREHGGEVRVESAVGEGTAFIIKLPLSDGEALDAR